MAELKPKDALRTAKGGPKVQKLAPGMTKLELKLKPHPATNAAPSTTSSKATTSPAPKVAVEKKLREAGKVVGVLVPLPPRPSTKRTTALAPRVTVREKPQAGAKVVGMMVPLPPRPSAKFMAAPAAGFKAEKEQLKEPQVYFVRKQEEDMEARDASMLDWLRGGRGGQKRGLGRWDFWVYGVGFECGRLEIEEFSAESVLGRNLGGTCSE